MKTEILMFGIAREIAGGAIYSLDIAVGATVADVKSELATRFPQFGDLRSFMIAKNNEYASDDQVISPSDEIAIIPPVSGG